MMKKLRVKIYDMVAKGPTSTLWAKIMHANLASIMPTVVATWCKQQGHDVSFTCYTGTEKLTKELNTDVDIVFFSSFTQAAMLSYSLSNWYRSKGIVTVLGGPHARCYPQDAQKYFDYVLGFTDHEVIQEVLDECKIQKPLGRVISAKKQPTHLPGVRERWDFIEPTLKKAPFIKLVPMIGSMGCPYTCSFCIDSEVAYQPMDYDTIKDELKFLRTKFKKPWVAWHDPNFGVRFDDYMNIIEEAAPPDSFSFIAESSLSLLGEDHLKRLKKIGIAGILPGVESWYEMGNKSKARQRGIEKVKQVANHANMILDYLPYIQTNFVFGLDSDEGPEPFELTKKFIDLSPGSFPGYSLLTAFGQAAPLNLGYQKEDRVIAFPFHFLNNHLAMNVKPKNYEWIDFYEKVIDVTQYSFSKKAIYRRIKATSTPTSKWMNFMRAISSEGYGRIRFFKKILKQLKNDQSFRAYFEKDSDKLPEFYTNIVRKDLGSMWEWLPKGSLLHDPNAYLKSSLEQKENGEPVSVNKLAV